MGLKEVMTRTRESNLMWRNGVIKRLVFHVCQIQKVVGNEMEKHKQFIGNENFRMVANKNKKGKKAIWPQAIRSNENLKIGESHVK